MKKRISHDLKNIDLWHVRLREARCAGLKSHEFRELWGIKGGETWKVLRHNMEQIEPELFQWSKPYSGESLPPSNLTSEEKPKKRPYNMKKRKQKIMMEKKQAYQRERQVELIERPTQVIIPEQKSSRPIFCLVVGFESKEAAFKAMGQL